jgi:hypothetical protein
MADDTLTVGLIIKFLDASYDTNPPPAIEKYKRVTEANDSKFKELCVGFSESEKQYVKVYFSPTHCVVVHRGTDKSDLTDVYFANCAVEIGFKCKYSETRRYIVSKRIQEWAEQRWWPYQITTLGHSQGSLLAALVGQGSKEIIKVQPLHRETYKETEKEITIRSANDFVDRRPVDTVGISDPTKHVYVAVDPRQDKTYFENITGEAIKKTTGINIDEHDYNIVFKGVNKAMQIGVNAKMFSARDEYYDMMTKKAELQKFEPGKTEEPEKTNMALIKKIGVGALIMGVGYAGYKWYKKNKKTKQRSSPSKLKKTIKREPSSRLSKESLSLVSSDRF